MKYAKFIVIGAGPSGLTFANRLKENGEDDFLVLEKEDVVGGLCRSVVVDGSAFDICGGHFVDANNMAACEYAFKFMPEDEWNLFTRDSRIFVNGMEIAHPFEANIWQFPENLQKDYLTSIAAAGCNVGAPMPDKFTDWIRWKLGDKIANDYMLPYNTKLFADNLDLLDCKWLDKLPNVSYEDTLASCRDKKAYGMQPGHAKFYYPKKLTHGSGELWNRMAKAIEGHIVCSSAVTDIDYRYVQDFGRTLCVLSSKSGIYCSPMVINTGFWPEISFFEEMMNCYAARLKSVGIVTEYHAEPCKSPAQWIYYPDLALSYHRVLNRSAFLPGARGYWTETRLGRFPSTFQPPYSYASKYAYPLNTVNKKETVSKLLMIANCYGIYGLGRWGEWEHYNSDSCMLKAISLADRLCGGKNGS